MKRDIKQILIAWANVRRSKRTGLEYPYKSPSIPVVAGCGFDSRPLLSEDEAKRIDKAVLRLQQQDQILYSILKSIYINKQSYRSLAKNVNKSNAFICGQIKMAELYVLAKIDDTMDVIL